MLALQVIITPTLCFMISDQLLSSFLKPSVVTSVVNASQRSNCDLEWFLGNREALTLPFIFRFFTFNTTNTGFWLSWLLGSDPRPGEAHDLGQAGEKEALLVLEGRHGQGAGRRRLWLLRRWRRSCLVLSFRKTDQAFACKQGIVVGFQVPAAFWKDPLLGLSLSVCLFLWPRQMLDKSSIWWTLEWCCNSSTEMKFLLQTPHVNPDSPMISVIGNFVTKSWAGMTILHGGHPGEI